MVSKLSKLQGWWIAGWAPLIFLSIPAMAADPVTLSPSSLDWGVVAINQDHQKNLTLTNTTANPIQFQARITSGNTYFTSVTDSCSSTIPASGTCSLTVTFNPGTTNTVQTGQLTVDLAVSPVTNVTATDGTLIGQISLAWTAPPDADAGTSYEVRYKKTSDPTSVATWATPTAVTTGTSYLVTGLADGDEYDFQVRAKNVVGVSEWRPADPGVEQGYAARACSTTTPLVWGNCQATPATGTPGTSLSPLENTALGYEGSITATCNGATGTWQTSNSVCASLDAPSSLSASDGTEVDQILVSWGNVTGATGYELEVSSTGSDPWTSVGTYTTTTATYAVTDDQIYSFRVRIQKNAAISDWSSPDTGYRAKSCPANPALNWGPGSACQGTIAQGLPYSEHFVENTVPTTAGSMSVRCNGVTGVWEILDSQCAFPARVLSATDGTVDYGVRLTWDHTGGADAYVIQKRLTGATDWETLETKTAAEVCGAP